ncbi:hypothetical protein ACSBR1_000727 [Camellia fascicularis]
MTESFAQDFSIPRGGPIYTLNMVSPLTRVSDFETSMLQELHILHKDLSSESMESCDDDILVDELKIVTDEELVSMAFDEASKDDHQVDDKKSTRNSNSCLDSSGYNNESSSKTIAKKRKRGNGRRKKKKNHNLESYSAKIEQLVRIKQKQDEERAETRLHSFNGG